MKTYPTKEWTDKECALALMEAILNMGQHAADGLVKLAMDMKDHAAIMRDLEEAFLRQRKKEMPDSIRQGLARAVEGSLRAIARDAAVENRSLNWSISSTHLTSNQPDHETYPTNPRKPDINAGHDVRLHRDESHPEPRQPLPPHDALDGRRLRLPETTPQADQTQPPQAAQIPRITQCESATASSAQPAASISLTTTWS